MKIVFEFCLLSDFILRIFFTFSQNSEFKDARQIRKFDTNDPHWPLVLLLLFNTLCYIYVYVIVCYTNNDINASLPLTPTLNIEHSGGEKEKEK